MMKKIAGLLLLTLIAACAPLPQAAPEPAAPPPAAPPPAPRPAPALTGDWTDWPAAPGDWTYRGEPAGSVASFGAPGAAPRFSLRCDKGRILLLHPGVLPAGKAAMMTVTATAGGAAYPVQNVAGGLPYVVATLTPRDAMLDKVIFSRGRFLVQVEGAPGLVLPSWPEIARVVEDCRG
ncbi:hypothetical protein [Sphingobium boeckii]|uniref:Lipoprotein n=1 Tax=Sphingobium boeckii TaxID=1082345 RepID=A0A7W9AFJ9_9SPHN|nr:hypothetical protein [Sphingobium boeckii]MBB5684526.1 hypothetical protein [Sphingobium boeckii]